jgi:holo-[acyl-carrier protein] synthase
MTAAAPADLRVGLDVVVVEDVARTVERFGDRYLERIFTAHELGCCRREGSPGDDGTWSAESLAARFAAKEAVLKVLRPADVQPEWRSIELHRMTGGWCEIRLSGSAEELAVASGIDGLSVSVSHEATVAAAVVVGWCSQRDRGEG